MKIKVNTETEYLGKDNPSVESLYIEIESEVGDTDVDVANTYLKVREILKAGLKKEGN